MFKLLITGLIIYFIYRYFIKPAAELDSGPKREERKINANTDKTGDDEYADYEEIK